MLTHSTPTPPGTVVSSGGGGGAAVHGGDHDVRGEVGQPSDSAVVESNSNPEKRAGEEAVASGGAGRRRGFLGFLVEHGSYRNMRRIYPSRKCTSDSEVSLMKNREPRSFSLELTEQSSTKNP